jgi:VWFA-related protein
MKALAWLVALACVGAAPQQPVFRAGTDVVLVNVLVTRGRTPVADLGTADFELRDNGVPQDVEVFALRDRAIDVTFVSGPVFESQLDELRRGRQSSEAFRALLRPDDRLRLIVGGERVREQSMRPARDAAGFGPEVVRGIGSSLNDALVYALMRPVDPDRGHLVVAYTGGLESWSTLDAKWIPDIARRADAVLHAVVPGPPPTDRGRGQDSMRSESGTRGIGWVGPGVPSRVLAQWRATYGALDDAVRATGGSLHHVSTGADAFQRILDDFRSSYVLRYTPRGVDRGGWHEIGVKVTRSGSFTVRARKGYEGGP